MKYEFRLVIPSKYPLGTLFQDMQGHYQIAETYQQAVALKAQDLSAYYRQPVGELINQIYVDHTWTKPIAMGVMK